MPWNIFQPDPEPRKPEVVDLATPERPCRIKQECLDDEAAPAQPESLALPAEAAEPCETLPLLTTSPMETEMPEPTKLLYESDLTPEKQAPCLHIRKACINLPFLFM